MRRFAAVPELPAGFTGILEPAERVVTMGELAGGGYLVLTQLACGYRRAPRPAASAGTW